MFGKRFCPRIRGLHRQWLYCLDRQRDYGPLDPIVKAPKHTLHLEWITVHWDRIGQFFASFAAGQSTASVALKRLLACGPRNHFYRAVRELGRLYKSMFILDYLSDPELRRRIRRGLLKSEQLHALARRVHYGKRGQTDGRDFQQQMSRASCLVLIEAAIIFWQILQIDEVLRFWDLESEGIDPRFLAYTSPIRWDNVILYGEYAMDRTLIVCVQMPSEPTVTRFYGLLLYSMHAPPRPRARVDVLETLALRIMRGTGVRMLVIDELHNILAGSPTRQREFLALLRFLGNELRIPIVGVGTKEAYLAIRSDDQLENRFAPFVLPLWQESQELASLITSFLSVLPLRRRSDEVVSSLLRSILDKTEGTIGEMATLLTRAAVLAIETGEECMHRDLLLAVDYDSPTERRRAFERELV